MNQWKFNDHVIKITKSNLNHNLPDSYKIIETIIPNFLNVIVLDINNPNLTSYIMLNTYWKIYDDLMVIYNVVLNNMDNLIMDNLIMDNVV